MVAVTIKNQSGFEAKVKIGTQSPKLVSAKMNGTTTFDDVTADETGKVIFQATPLGKNAVLVKAAIPWDYNPLRDMTIALKVDNNTGQLFFEPGSIL